jgi:hypothetical protein
MKFYLFLCLSSIIAISFAQVKPESFYLLSDKNYVSKINSSNPVSNSILDIVTIGDTVWLGTSKGVSLSFDKGENWTNFYGTFSFGNDDVSALAYNKYDGSIWAATATSVDFIGGGTVPKGTGLKYTTDNGLTWTAIPQPVDPQDSSTVRYGINTLTALPITAEEQNLTYDIAFTSGAVWITSWAGGIRRSTDMGQTWQRIVLPPDYLSSIRPDETLNFCLSPKAGNFCDEENLNHVAFSLIAINDTVLYVGTANGINKTLNPGDPYPSWIKFNHQNQNEPMSGNFITALGYNFSTNTIWASTWKANGETEFYGVSSSTNGGESWNVFLQDERTHNFGFKDNEVLALTDNGAFRSVNQGNTWVLPTAIIDTISDPTSKIYLRTNTYYSASSQLNNIIWLGSDDGLVKLEETSFWTGKWKIYFASQPLKSENETYCYPNPFNPRQEQLKVIFSTNNQPANVTIRIFDFGMNYIRTVIQNVQRQRGEEGPPEFWDGKDDNGNFLPNGVYFYRVDINDDEPLFGKIIYLQ